MQKSQSQTNTQNKAILKLDPTPEPIKVTSIKILHDMKNKTKERITNYRDENNKAILLERWEMSIDTYLQHLQFVGLRW